MRRQSVHYYSQYINGQNSMLKRANILKKKIFWNRNYLVFSKSTHRVLSSYKLRGFFLNFVQGFTQDESRLQIAHYYTVHKYTSCPKYMYLQNSMEFRARVLEFISLLNIQPYF